MPPSIRLFWVTALAVFLALARAATAEEAPKPAEPQAAPSAQAAPAAQTAQTAESGSTLGMPEKPYLDLDHSETFMDVSEAVRSRQYVHRTILSTVIKATSRFAGDRFYVNHLLGFSSVLQADPGVKYSTALQGLAAGYVSMAGHGIEAGLELSSISNIYVGYRYFYRPSNFALWPIFGFGAGYEVAALQISRPPTVTDPLTFPKMMGYGVVALLLPLVDVGLRAEVRISFQGVKRIVITQGLGAVLFL